MLPLKALLSRLLFFVLVMALLVSAARVNYPLFHASVETLSVVCSLCVAAVVWVSWDLLSSSFLRLVAMFSLSTAVLDLVHMLTYKGMSVLPELSTNVPTQLWTASRGVQALATFGGFVLPGVALSKRALAPLALALPAVLTWMVFQGYFPDCFVEGQGLTTFKMVTEYLFTAVFAVLFGAMWRNWRAADRRVVLFMGAYLGFNAIAGILFARYAGPYDAINMAGHLFRLTASFCLYLVLFDLGFREPFAVLFRDLKSREERLLAAKERAESATEARGRFLAHMSHEIRTPMSGVVAVVDLLAGTGLNPIQTRYLSLLNVSVENLMRIVNDVLDFSKLEAGRLVLAREPFALRQVLRDGVLSFLARAEQKGVTLSLDLATDLPSEARGDAVRLGQITANLVSNALKYTDKGFVRVQFHAEKKDEGEGIALVGSVTDSGVGIPPHRLASVFEVFEQADVAAARERGGTGLGLAIVRELVECMGGSIAAESELGKGSCFRFRVLLPPPERRPDANVS